MKRWGRITVALMKRNAEPWQMARLAWLSRGGAGSRREDLPTVLEAFTIPKKKSPPTTDFIDSWKIRGKLVCSYRRWTWAAHLRICLRDTWPWCCRTVDRGRMFWLNGSDCFADCSIPDVLIIPCFVPDLFELTITPSGGCPRVRRSATINVPSIVLKADQSLLASD